jgi:hypothetical protein
LIGFWLWISGRLFICLLLAMRSSQLLQISDS